LVIEHVWTRPGMMAGSHWHPVPTETFRVLDGRMRFRAMLAEGASKVEVALV
jgi:oxalate decarboxylase/phosphoglucose isomerase-like protein (cupin superfamily)